MCTNVVFFFAPFVIGPDPECHLKCGEHGSCNHNNICQCHPGYIGQYCETPVCFPQCMNGGNCTAPSVCTCPDGYQGIKCEGGTMLMSYLFFMRFNKYLTTILHLSCRNVC